MQRVQELSLVFVNALDLTVEHRVGVDGDGLRRASCICATITCDSRSLLARFTARHFSWNALSDASGTSFFSCVEVGDPAHCRSSLVMSSDRRRVRLEQPATLRDAVGLVVELLGSERRRSRGTRRVFKICVCRAATPLTLWLPTMARLAMRTLLLTAPSSMIDMRRHARVVSGEALRARRRESARLISKMSSQVPRQHATHHRDRATARAPRASRCGSCSRRSSCVISHAVSQSRPSRSIKIAHQLGHRQRRVRVVQLHRVALGELREQLLTGGITPRLQSCSFTCFL